MLLASLAVELQHGVDDARRTALATDALAVARATQDPVALGHVLTRSWASLVVTGPYVEEFGRLNAEAEAIAVASDDLVALRDVNIFAMAMAAMVGDRAESAARLGEVTRLSDRLRRRDVRVQVRWREAQQAIFEGRLGDGERFTIEGLELSVDSGIDPENVSATVGALFYGIRQAQGRLDELIPAIQDLVVAQPGLPTWRIALSGAFYESGRVEEAREHWDWLVADGCAVLRRDPMYPVNLCGLARESYHLRPPAGTAPVRVRRAAPVRRHLQLEWCDHHRGQRHRARAGRRGARPARRGRPALRRRDRAVRAGRRAGVARPRTPRPGDGARRPRRR